MEGRAILMYYRLGKFEDIRFDDLAATSKIEITTDVKTVMRSLTPSTRELGSPIFYFIGNLKPP